MKRYIGRLTACVLILGMLGYWVHTEWKYAAQIKHHAQLKTLSAFMEYGVEYRRLHTFSRDGKTYLFWTQPIPEYPFVFPSGPACYIFNSSGNMVDYTPDAGDDSSFREEWMEYPPERILDSPRQFLSEQKE